MRALRRHLSLLAVAVATLAQQTPARGDSADDAVARMHNRAGEAFYAAKRYPQALAEFTTGFDLTKRPGFLINIAQTYRKIGKLGRAIEFYRTFLTLDPTSKVGPEVRALIAQIENELKERGAEVPAAPSPTPSPSRPPTPVAIAIVPPPAVNPPPPPRHPTGWRVLTWVGLGLTVAAVAAAGGLQGAAVARYNSLKGSCAPPHGMGCADGDIDGVARTAQGATGLFITGGIFAAATIVAAVLETRANRSK
jgi:hypothetical protein